MEQLAYKDPDTIALLIAQQFLHEQGYATALKATEQQNGRSYVESKLPQASMLLEMIYKALEEQALEKEDERQAVQAARDEEDALLSAAATALPVHQCLEAGAQHAAAVTALALDDSAIFSGAGSGRVRRTNADGSVAWDAQVAASGILALAVVLPPHEGGGSKALVATSMDGGVSLLDCDTGSILAKGSPHRKYVVAAAITSNRRLVTGSWDATLCVMQLPPALDEHDIASCHVAGEMTTLATHTFASGVADLAMLPDGRTAVVALKGGCRLRLFDTEALQETAAVNMNDFEWDEHLSFSATSLAVSPDGAFLLVSTSGPRIMVLRIRDWSKAKLLYGLHTAEQFHHYAACWVGRGHVAAAAAGGQVFIFRLSDGKVVEKLAAHPGSNVRALVCTASGDRLVTGSFNKSTCVFLAS